MEPSQIKQEEFKKGPPELEFNIHEGNIRNYFYRHDIIASHLLLTSGQNPRIVVAFPAENEGMALWFKESSKPVELVVEGKLRGIQREDGFWGIKAAIKANVSSISLKLAILGGIRVIRDYLSNGVIPEEVSYTIFGNESKILERKILDGRRFQFHFIPESNVKVIAKEDNTIEIKSELEESEDAILKFQIVALTQAKPLTPIYIDKLLLPNFTYDESDLRGLAFLSYDEKLLAGSWRFLTYFGRDTLMSVRLLMPVMLPELIEAGIRAVLERIGPNGEVAHEEDLGVFSALRRKKENLGGDITEPIYDYKMIDDDFMLAPLVAHYLLETQVGQERAEQLLARKCGDQTYAQLLSKNLDYILTRTEPFARTQNISSLISIRANEKVGEWRDSMEGLGGGRIPYNVNAALVPAALQATVQLLNSGLLGKDPDAKSRANHIAGKWDNVGRYFLVKISPEEANKRLNIYLNDLKIDPSIIKEPVKDIVECPAVSLDEQGKPIEVMHSDAGFLMLFTNPNEAELNRAALRILEPFPLGLSTPIGIIVANPAFASDQSVWKDFTRNHYHGTVIWSWQQALMAAGLRKQIERPDLSDQIKEKLRQAETKLWKLINITYKQRTGELWSWEIQNGEIKLVPFRQEAGHITESNAIQLWSTVYLGIRPPK